MTLEEKINEIIEWAYSVCGPGGDVPVVELEERLRDLIE